MMQNKTLLLILTFIIFQVNANSQKNIIHTIDWTQNTENLENLTFRGAQYTDGSELPYFSGMFKVDRLGEVKMSVVSIESSPFAASRQVNDVISSNPTISTHVIQERNTYYAVYSFIPFRKNPSTGEIEKITKIELSYSFQPNSNFVFRGGPEFKTSSVLRDGDIYKYSVSKSAIHKLTYEDLESKVSNLGDIDPRNIQVFGNSGGMNYEGNFEPRIDDLQENAIFIQGESDGSFDRGDYILFYAHGPHSWTDFKYRHNIYDDHNYYFLKIGNEQGKRVQDRANMSVDTYAKNYDTYKRYEKDEFNLLADFVSTQGSGKTWFSDKLKAGQLLNLSSSFEDEHIDLSEDASFEIQVAGRSSTSSIMELTVDGVKNTIQFNGVSTSRIESTYADLENRTINLRLNSKNPTVELSYRNAAGDADAWLDFIHMEYKAQLIYDEKPITFASKSDFDVSTFGYDLSDYKSGLRIWDVTNPQSIFNQESNNGRFGYASSGTHQFAVFDPLGTLEKPLFVSEIENQNLHSLEKADLIILYHPDFQEAAERLAQHRATHSDMNVASVSIDQVNNEFSSGRSDIPGIRNFDRMMYLRDPNFRFFALLGDGTYDYKHKDGNADENFIPVYETSNSLHPINSFPSDDFYALLDEQEGDNLIGGLDVAVGRIPARTLSDANIVVDKIIGYDTDEDALADWRLKIGFVADDEDSNIHLRDSDDIAEKSRLKYPDFNVEKIYFDAYPQVSTPGGERYPRASEALYNNLFKGMLTLCYLGHGGSKGWAQERVLKREDVAGWNNKEKLPLMVTATCSFTGFDNPAEVSAGETILFEENGGAIGLMSTVRAVYVNRNKVLTESVFDTIFTKPNNQFMGIGEVLRRAKNSNPRDTVDVNARKFLLIGDPSLKLAIPKLNIITSSINGEPIDSNYEPDTVRALQEMTFEGYVANDDGSIAEDFNGVVSASVFDKLIQAQTLGNDAGSSVRPFNLQKTVLFKGQSQVVNGKFNFSFHLPADINFKFGKGKISLYAKSGNIDASGRFEDFIIGGSKDGVSDDSPPVVDVFLNDEDFVFGGISNSEPIIIAKLTDDFGINVAGVSVGHDLIAELDGNSKESYILNDFYQADLNDSRSGTVRFPLKDIEPGKHTLKIQAWDLSNNPGEGYTEFIVVDDMTAGLEHVFNYPNPFSTRTLFQFEHNLPGTELEILIHIYNMSGQIVKTIEHLTIDDGFRIDDIEWDGLDDYGEKIANGVYLYKINVRANQLDISKESNYEKLVILK